MSFVEFIKSPYLWHKAHRDHRRAVQHFYQKFGTLGQQAAADATWEPYDRTWKYLEPAFIMTIVYAFMLVGLAMVIVAEVQG
jgi:hypothetical protein